MTPVLCRREFSSQGFTMGSGGEEMRKLVPIVLLVLGLTAVGVVSYLNGKPKSVVATVTVYFTQDDLRQAIKDTISQHSGPIDIAIYGFTDLALRDLLAQQTRPIRILFSSESVSRQEKRVCESL